MNCLDCVHNNVCTAFSNTNDQVKERLQEFDFADKCVYFANKNEFINLTFDNEIGYYIINKHKKVRAFNFKTRGEYLDALDKKLFGISIFNTEHEAIRWLETHGKKSAFKKYRKLLFSKKK